MFSLSHLAIVAIVVAAVVAAWKFERQKPRGSSIPSQRARPKSIRRELLKLGALIALLMGALTPAFGLEAIPQLVHYVHVICTLGLAAFAYLWLFPSGQE